MAINRRQFLKFSALAVLGSVAPGVVAGGSADYLLSCRNDEAGKHFVSLFDPTSGDILWDIQLPSRGHGVCLSPDHKHAAVFARRPGDFMWVLDLNKRSIVHKISSSEDRHYYGHGVFSHDGKHLYASENDFENAEGKIGVYAVEQGFIKIYEFSSYGIGPHEIGLLSDGQTLVAANGGIRTHPDMPRAKLNIATMRPNLAYIDVATGEMLRRFEPPQEWHQLSIRHIDVSRDNQVAIAMQYEGAKHKRPPLIAIQQGNGELQMLKAPEGLHKQMKNYCGSVTYARDGKSFAVSSPRGGLISYWGSDGEFLGVDRQADACGLASRSCGFWVSDGRGKVTKRCLSDIGSPVETVRTQDTLWDNHMVSYQS